MLGRAGVCGNVSPTAETDQTNRMKKGIATVSPMAGSRHKRRPVARREPVDQAARQEDAAAHADEDEQGVPDRHLLERHAFLLHQEQHREIARGISDELVRRAGERDEQEDRAGEEHPDRRAERRLGRRHIALGGAGRHVQPAAARLAHHQPDDQGRRDADRADRDEGVAPAIGRGDRGAEGHAERLADGRADIEQAERGAARAGREIVGDDRIGGRHAAGLADPDRHPRQHELRIVGGHAAGDGRPAPQGAGERQHLHAIGPVGQPAHRDRDHAVEQREIEPADQAELAVAEAELVPDRLGQDRQQLPVQEIQHVDEAQDAEHEPGALCGARPWPANAGDAGRHCLEGVAGADADRARAHPRIAGVEKRLRDGRR